VWLPVNTAMGKGPEISLSKAQKGFDR
jgi:hypothetical protein